MANPPFTARPIEPTFTMLDWNGRPIQAAQNSRRDVIAVADFADNLIAVPSIPWPPATIVQKLCRNAQHECAFEGTALALVTRKLGFYTDLQSMHSEDAITWNFFGTLGTASAAARVAFLNWLLLRIGLTGHEEMCTIELWRRIPHPDTKGTGGPEIDFLLHGDHAVVVGEAKWRSREGRGQGVRKDKSQVQLRTEFCQSTAPSIFASEHYAVLCVVRREPLAPDSDPDCSLVVRTITWADLLKWPDHPYVEQFRRYYEWKQHWSKK